MSEKTGSKPPKEPSMLESILGTATKIVTLGAADYVPEDSSSEQYAEPVDTPVGLPTFGKPLGSTVIPPTFSATSVVGQDQDWINRKTQERVSEALSGLDIISQFQAKVEAGSTLLKFIPAQNQAEALREIQKNAARELNLKPEDVKNVLHQIETRAKLFDDKFNAAIESGKAEVQSLSQQLKAAEENLAQLKDSYTKASDKTARRESDYTFVLQGSNNQIQQLTQALSSLLS